MLDDREAVIFSTFLTQQRKRTTSWEAENNAWRVRERNATKQESWQNEWPNNEYQGVVAKAPPCPETTLKTPTPQQSSPSSRDEESQWVAVEDRRRRRVAFEETAGGILRYLEDSQDLKVSVTELQEQWECPEKHVSPLSKLPAGQKRERPIYFEIFLGQCQLGQMECAVERSGGVGKKVSKIRQKVNLLSNRQEIFIQRHG